jgi:hypothetical protein
MTDEELREMIRESIARHVAPSAPSTPSHSGSRDSFAALHMHSSHARLPLSRGTDDDGACIIEPAVRCNHCGFCLSFGH